MLRPLSAKGGGVSNSHIPPRAAGVLWPPAAQFYPGSILHTAGYVALCELFLGCEAHFDLWRRLFCLIPRNQGESTFEVGGSEVWRIAGTGYLSGTPKKAPEDWSSEWFYIDDVALPEFSNAPLKKRHSWRPRSLEEEDSA